MQDSTVARPYTRQESPVDSVSVLELSIDKPLQLCAVRSTGLDAPIPAPRLRPSDWLPSCKDCQRPRESQLCNPSVQHQSGRTGSAYRPPPRSSRLLQKASPSRADGGPSGQGLTSQHQEFLESEGGRAPAALAGGECEGLGGAKPGWAEESSLAGDHERAPWSLVFEFRPLVISGLSTWAPASFGRCRGAPSCWSRSLHHPARRPFLSRSVSRDPPTPRSVLLAYARPPPLLLDVARTNKRLFLSRSAPFEEARHLETASSRGNRPHFLVVARRQS